MAGSLSGSRDERRLNAVNPIRFRQPPPPSSLFLPSPLISLSLSEREPIPLKIINNTFLQLSFTSDLSIPFYILPFPSSSSPSSPLLTAPLQAQAEFITQGWTGPPLNLQLGTYLSGTLIKASYPNRSLSRSLPRDTGLPSSSAILIRDATGNGAMNRGQHYRYQKHRLTFFGKWYQQDTCFRSKLSSIKRNIVYGERTKLKKQIRRFNQRDLLERSILLLWEKYKWKIIISTLYL